MCNSFISDFSISRILKLDYNIKMTDNRKEKRFRNFVATRINSEVSICRRDLIESGAEKNNVSIDTAKNYLAKMASSLGELALYDRKCSLPNCDGYHIYEKDKGKPTHQYF